MEWGNTGVVGTVATASAHLADPGFLSHYSITPLLQLSIALSLRFRAAGERIFPPSA
jgi:hypothetical protein